MGGENRNDVIIQTKYGKVRGRDKDDLMFWFGIPYAQPPVGDLRWRAPKTLKRWDGILNTIEYRSKSTQLEKFNIVGSEDCLYLNIWRPNKKKENLPVLVYVHGGGNLIGAGDEFNGALLSKYSNSVIVTINFRLGPMGWFKHDSLETSDPLNNSGNFGLLDIFKSLEWIQDNIKAFGGDSDNVTLLGLSAGARNILATLISPLSVGLFHKAIILSGGMTLTNSIQGKDFSETLIKKLAIKDGIVSNGNEANNWINRENSENIKAYLHSKDASEIVSLIGATSIKMDLFPHLYKDGYVIPKEGFDLLKTGNYHKVPIILGATSSEFAGFVYRETYWGQSVADRSIFNNNYELLKLYEDSVYYGSKLYAIFNVNQIANILVNTMDQPEVFAYRFNWGLREGVVDMKIKTLMGACHGIDIDFITRDFREGFMKSFYSLTEHFTEDNRIGRKMLSEMMMKYIKNFLKNGTPNSKDLPHWDSWKKENPGNTLFLDADKDKAIIKMIDFKETKSEILEEMNKNLLREKQNIITQKLFKGRFFWEYS